MQVLIINFIIVILIVCLLLKSEKREKEVNPVDYGWTDESRGKYKCYRKDGFVLYSSDGTFAWILDKFEGKNAPGVIDFFNVLDEREMLHINGLIKIEGLHRLRLS